MSSSLPVSSSGTRTQGDRASKSSHSGNIGNAGGTLCTSRAPNFTYTNGNVGFQGNNPMGVQFIAPYSDEVEFDDILPNVGLSWNPTDSQQLYLSYAEGLSAPRTDNLYAVVRLPNGDIARPTPESEMTKSIDLGWRLNHPTNIASLALYKIDYQNRIVSTFNADLGYSEDRNVGDVAIEGFDAQVGHRFGDALSLTVSASYNDSELEGSLNPDNGTGRPTNTNNQSTGAGTAGGGLAFDRRAYVSLAGSWGELRLGHDFVPTHYNSISFDPFNANGVARAGNLTFAGAGLGSAPLFTAITASNSVSYWLPPNLGGFYGVAMVALGENASNTANSKDGNMKSVRIGYAQGAFDVAAALAQWQSGESSGRQRRRI